MGVQLLVDEAVDLDVSDETTHGQNGPKDAAKLEAVKQAFDV